MALTKTIASNASYIVLPNTTTTTGTSASVEPSVQDGNLVPGHRITNPGVFTQGTAYEGGINQIDSNS